MSIVIFREALLQNMREKYAAARGDGECLDKGHEECGADRQDVPISHIHVSAHHGEDPGPQICAELKRWR